MASPPSPSPMPQAGSCTTSPSRSGMLSMLASSASGYLPASLSLRRGGSSNALAPPPVSVPVRLLCGEEAVVGVNIETTVQQLQQKCQQAAGVRPDMQRICIQEEPREPGLSGLLRSTANNLSSRQRMARQLTDWSSFFLLPEGVSRELRGQGLVSWANDNVWQQLKESQPPPGTVRVLVATLDGRRRCILVRSSSSIAALRHEVQQRAAIPADQQRLVVLEQQALGAPQRVLWALLRLLLGVLLWAGSWLVAGGRMVLGLPPSLDVHLRLLTESGREVKLRVSPDTSLQQLQRLVWEQHGESLNLQQLLSVSPSKAGSNSPERRGGPHPTNQER